MTVVDDRPPPSEDEVSEEESLSEEEETTEVEKSTVVDNSNSDAVQKKASEKGEMLQANSSSNSNTVSVAASESVAVEEPKCAVVVPKTAQKVRGRTVKPPKRRQESAELLEDSEDDKEPPLPMKGVLKVPKQFEKYTTKIKLHSTNREKAAAMKIGKAMAAKAKSARSGRSATTSNGSDTKEESSKSKKSGKKNSKKISKKSKQTTEKSTSNKHGTKVIKSKQAARPEPKSVRKPKPVEAPAFPAHVDPSAKQYVFASELQNKVDKASNGLKPVNTRSALPVPKIRSKISNRKSFFKVTKGAKSFKGKSRNVCKVLTEVHPVKDEQKQVKASINSSSPSPKAPFPSAKVATPVFESAKTVGHSVGGTSCALNTVTEKINIPKKRIETAPVAVFTNDEMEDLNDELSDLNTSISTLRNSYGSIIRSLANLQKRRANKKAPALGPVTQNPNDSFMKAPDGGNGGPALTVDDICQRVNVDYTLKYNLDRFLNADTRDAVFVELFREVNQINSAMSRFKTFFDTQGYFQQATYQAQDEFLLTREQYTACLKVIKDLAKSVVTILKAYNTDLLDMFRITSQAN